MHTRNQRPHRPPLVMGVPVGPPPLGSPVSEGGEDVPGASTRHPYGWSLHFTTQFAICGKMFI